MSVSPPNNATPAPSVITRRRRRPGRRDAPLRDSARPGRLNDVRDAQREYVAGGLAPWTAKAAALPQAIDDLTVDFGNDVYEQMLLDPQVAACGVILKASIIEDGLELISPVDDPEEANYKKAMDIRDAAARMLELLDQPLDEVLWTMLDGMFFGNKVAEIVSELQQVDGKTRLNVVSIKPKPRRAVAFVVDPFMNLIGILGAKPGEYIPPGVGMPVKSDDPRILDREKFAIFSFRVVDADPRGTSILRAGYEAWWRKRQILQDYLKYLGQFAGPSMWATPPENTAVLPMTDVSGNPTDVTDFDEDGIPDVDDDLIPGLTASDDLLQCLIDFRNGTALAVPFGTEIHPIEMQGNGEAFLAAIAQADEQITKSLLTQQLATEQGIHQTRAAATVHQDVLDTIVRQARKALQRMIEHDILAPWVIRNYGPEAADLVPIPTLGLTEQHDEAAVITAFAALQRSGYIHQSQYPAIDSKLGLPVRDLTMMPELVPPGPSPAPGEPNNNGSGNGNGRPANPATKPVPAPQQGRGGQPRRAPAAPASATVALLTATPRSGRRPLRWLPRKASR